MGSEVVESHGVHKATEARTHCVPTDTLTCLIQKNEKAAPRRLSHTPQRPLTCCMLQACYPHLATVKPENQTNVRAGLNHYTCTPRFGV